MIYGGVPLGITVATPSSIPLHGGILSNVKEISTSGTKISSFIEQPLISVTVTVYSPVSTPTRVAAPENIVWLLLSLHEYES